MTPGLSGLRMKILTWRSNVLLHRYILDLGRAIKVLGKTVSLLHQFLYFVVFSCLFYGYEGKPLEFWTSDLARLLGISIEGIIRRQNESNVLIFQEIVREELTINQQCFLDPHVVWFRPRPFLQNKLTVPS